MEIGAGFVMAGVIETAEMISRRSAGEQKFDGLTTIPPLLPNTQGCGLILDADASPLQAGGMFSSSKVPIMHTFVVHR
jgi:hypothetical protein